MRLYRVLLLFDPDRIAQNFRTMGDTFDSRVVHRGPTPSPYRHEPAPLPATYPYLVQPRDLAAFLDRTGTTGLLVLDATFPEGRLAVLDAQTGKALWNVTNLPDTDARFGLACR
mgnify:CR=1 FL=1